MAEASEPARWYACYTRARAEKKVHDLLPRRGIECYLPLIPRVRQWADRKKVVEWPLFPSYVFGRFALDELHTVLATPGVSTVVRVDGAPVPIPAEELDNVRRFVEALTKADAEPEFRPYLAEGQWVLVREGPFRGIRGMVVERRSRRRVMVGISAIRQGLEVDIDTKFLMPIPPPEGAGA